jgi:hypothetical protein
MAESLRSRPIPLRVTALVTMLAALACSDSPVAPGWTPSGPRVGKSAGSPIVSAASPSYGSQGTVSLDVTITGSGFDQGSQAAWALSGVVNGKVHVNRTQFVSSSKLVANISIASDAAIADYDVMVTTTGGKQGIGSELFTVTSAVAIPITTGYAIDDAGQVVGLGGSKGADAVLWDPMLGVITLEKSATVFAIDPAGTTIIGKNAAGRPAVWTSTSGATGFGPSTTLPGFGAGGTARGVAWDATGHALFISGAVIHPDGSRDAAIWTRTTAGWQLTALPLPPGAVGGGLAQDVNARGMAVGFDGVSCCVASYWDSSGTVTTLEPIVSGAVASAWSISGDGNIIVGQSNSVAVMWTRTSSGAFGVPVALEPTAVWCGSSGRSATSVAHAINTAGTWVVGASCGKPMAWKLAPGAAPVRVQMEGLGPPNVGEVFGINDLASPLAAGTASNAGAYWHDFAF